MEQLEQDEEALFIFSKKATPDADAGHLNSFCFCFLALLSERSEGTSALFSGSPCAAVPADEDNELEGGVDDSILTGRRLGSEAPFTHVRVDSTS